jgi:hypothetical protein
MCATSRGTIIIIIIRDRTHPCPPYDPELFFLYLKNLSTVPRIYSTTSYCFYPWHYLRHYCYCWGLRPPPPERLLPLLLMGVTGRSVLVLAVEQGTCACAGRRGSGCDSYSCCWCWCGGGGGGRNCHHQTAREVGFGVAVAVVAIASS